VRSLYQRFSTQESDLIRHAIALVDSRDNNESCRPRGLDVALILLKINVTRVNVRSIKTRPLMCFDVSIID
jgi:hypothetical protein